MITVTLPWSNPGLSPNARTHWRELSRLKAAARYDGYIAAKHALESNSVVWNGEFLPVTLTFHPPDRRARDDDNLEASFKSYRDGISEALGINDRLFVVTRRVGEVVKFGKIVVKIGA